MAVYTPLTYDEISEFLRHYTVGELVSAHGITEGIENTNYLLEIKNGTICTRYILTIFEKRVNAAQLPFFMGLTAWLADRGISCPRPVAGWSGATIYDLKDKRASLVEFLEGDNNPDITPTHCAMVGQVMARMHLATEGFPMTRRNSMGRPEWQALFAANRVKLHEIDLSLETLMAEELAWLEKHWPSGLPRGIIHGDIFPDNVFFKRHHGDLQLSGVIDFYFACQDFWLYDLMIAINAWCFDSTHQFVSERAQAMVDAYKKLRPFTEQEKAALPILARGAAMRFLATRCHDWLHRDPHVQVVPKDPMEYVAKLKFWQNN